MHVRRVAIASVLAIAVLAAPAEAATVPYTVRYGDTLTWIASAHHIGMLRLAELNHLDPYGILLAGSTIRVPAPAHHSAIRRHRPARHHRPRPVARGSARVVVVRRGQTLWSIAHAAGLSVDRLAAFNQRRVTAILPVGLHLRLPATRPRRHRPAVGQSRSAVAGLLRFWALRYRIDPRLVMAIAWQESGWRAGLRSSTGAEGLMQVMPDTWRYVEVVLVGRPLAHTESGNVHVGVAYLAHLLRDFDGDVALAVAGYYQGEEAVRLYGILPFSRAYVADVLALRGRM